MKNVEKDQVNHPQHYGGKDDPYEAIKVIEAWNLGFHLGNTIKYISRAGKKGNSKAEDLRKAQWYLNRYIEPRVEVEPEPEDKDLVDLRKMRSAIHQSGHSPDFKYRLLLDALDRFDNAKKHKR